MSIAIIGAGQSGLQLAFALLRDGEDVTVYSDRTADQIRTGRLPSSNGMYGRGLDRERDLGICFWDGEKPLIDHAFVRITDPDGNLAVAFDGRFTQHGQAVDQRLKFGAWLEAFEARGGKVIYGPVSENGLDAIAQTHKLVIVSAGKGEISRLFPTDPTRTVHNRPQRSIGMCALVGAVHDAPDGVYYNLRPGVGEVFGIPMVTAAGPAIAWVMEAIPGGPMDRWDQVTDAASMLDMAMRTFTDFFPWEFERNRGAQLADDNAWMCGSVSPLVRRPVTTLPSGRIIMAMGDVAVVNDPCTGQGANSASAHADIVHKAIRENKDRNFDATWMERTFETFWDYAQWPTRFTNLMLGTPPDHVQQLLAAAAEIPEVGHRFTNGFARPDDLQHFLFDPDLAQTYLTEASERARYSESGRLKV